MSILLNASYIFIIKVINFLKSTILREHLAIRRLDKSCRCTYIPGFETFKQIAIENGKFNIEDNTYEFPIMNFSLVKIIKLVTNKWNKGKLFLNYSSKERNINADIRKKLSENYLNWY